ncbi:MAG: R3H domain-containing nucleic acid-binding protein [Acidobacteriota bacterium]
MGQKQYFSGNNLRQAVLAAAAQLDVDADQLAFEEVEKKGGKLKGRRRVVIVVDGDNPVSGVEAAAAEPDAPPAAEPIAEAVVPAEAEVAPEEPAAVEVAPEATAEAAATEEPMTVAEETPAAAPPAAEEPATSQASAAPADPEPPAADEEGEEASGRLAKAADHALTPILDVAGLEVEIAIFQERDRLEIDLSGRDEDLLLAEKGELLLSIEHLLPRVIRGVAGETTAVRVDCANFHSAREDELRSMALRLADEVRESGRPRSTPPLGPGDRRVVHLAVVDDEDVSTASEGSGFHKKVKIRPA